MQEQRSIVRFLSDCEEIWHRRFPALHRRADWHIASHLCTGGRAGAAVGELSGIVKQVFLLDDATVRDRISELAGLGLCGLDPSDAALSARTIVLPTQHLLAGFDAFLRELAARVPQTAATGPPQDNDRNTGNDREPQLAVLAAVERCRSHVVGALEAFFDQAGLSRARRLDARRHLLSASHWGLLLIALGHRYAGPATAQNDDGILADYMAAALLAQIGQNLQTTRDHILYLIQLGLFERRSGRALRVALAEPAGVMFDQALAKAAEEMPHPAGHLPEPGGDVEQTSIRRASVATSDPPQPQHLLLIRRPGEPDREVPIGPDPLVIGRAPGSDILLPAVEVSRAHCRIALANGRVTVSDLNSTNGTLLNGRPLERTTPLLPDSVLEVGPYRLQYRCRDAPDPDATMRARGGLPRLATVQPRRHGT